MAEPTAWVANMPVAAVPRTALVNPALEWLAQMSQEEFRATFKDSPIKRAKYAGLRRNAAIAMGNSGDREFVAGRSPKREARPRVGGVSLAL